MKKTVIAISSIALAGVLVSGAFAANGAYEKSHAISSQSALEIALNDAGINKTEATNTKSILDREGVHYVFEVEFDSSTKEYDYTINAKTGEIIEKDIESRDDVKTTAVLTEATTEPTKAENQKEEITDPNATEKSVSNTEENSTAQTASTENNTDTISLDKAKNIAIDDAKVSADAVKFTKAKLDKDDGIQEYEIEFICNGKEYEYSINAKTGKIIDKDVETAEKTTVQQKTETSSANISIEEAKEIALNHANLSADDVRFEKVVLDKDDGIYEYEIEFTKGRTEYEYSINAKTGAIIEYDIDAD